jgi:hypothetical protein
VPNDTSLRDELSAGFDGAGDDPSAADPGAAAAALSEGAAQPPAQGAGGELAALEAPSHWPEADRGLFGKASREHQQNWLDREKRYQTGYDKVSQQLAQFKRDRESYDEIFRDMDRDLGLSGMSRQQFVSQLVQWNNYLSKDPLGAMRAMAERMGVDLKTLTEATAQDPQLSGVRKEVETLKQHLSSQERARQQETFRSNLSSVERFASAKGQDGKPLRPHFDEVASDVIQLIRAGERDLEVAYNKACRMNEKVWEKIQAEQAAATAKQQEDERKKRVDTARRAAVGTSGESTGTTQPKSLREDLESAFSSWPN